MERQAWEVLGDPILLATAGHIDHGKSSLVRIVTGIDPDRLPEEKARGITIVPGYAHVALEGGPVLSFVDVPGHERFLDHMIQGANGIRIVLLVVAADDGVMPQTLEHLEVARILGAEAGAVVITKTDLADPDWIALIREDLREHLEGTFLQDAPVLELSIHRPEAHGGFRQALGGALLEARRRLPAQAPRTGACLPIDRVLSVAGRGTVVTGTLAVGKIEEGDLVRIHPGARPARVREIQVHGLRREAAGGPTRLALNLSGLRRDEVGTGDLVVRADTSVPEARTWLGSFRTARWLDEPLRFPLHGTLHAGTAKALATVHTLAPELSPGIAHPVAVRIRLDRTLAAPSGTPWVIRGSVPAGRAGRTLGGGRLLLAGAVAARARSRRDHDALRALVAAELPRQVAGALSLHHPPAMRAPDLAAALNLPVERIPLELPRITAADGVWILEPGLAEDVEREVLSALAEHHGRRPQDAGLPLAEIRSRVAARAPAAACDALVDRLARSGKIRLDGPAAALPGHEIRLPPSLASLAASTLRLYSEAGLAPPFARQVATRLEAPPAEIREVLGHLVRQGSLVRISAEYHLPRPVHEAFLQTVRDHLDAEGQLRVDDLRGLTALSRKYLVPLLEDLDRRGITRRLDADRRVAGRSNR